MIDLKSVPKVHDVAHWDYVEKHVDRLVSFRIIEYLSVSTSPARHRERDVGSITHILHELPRKGPVLGVADKVHVMLRHSLEQLVHGFRTGGVDSDSGSSKDPENDASFSCCVYDAHYLRAEVCKGLEFARSLYAPQ